MRVCILGGGQLGRMLALAGYPLGLQTTVFDPTDEPCAGQVCTALRGEFEDVAALYELVKSSDVVTYEFENVPVESVRWLADRLPVYPPPRALEVSQDRVIEKTFLSSLGIPVPAFHAVTTEEDFRTAVQSIGFPCVLKTRRFGYDGKGQAVLRDANDADKAWQKLGGRPLILEGFVPFDRELSLIVVRNTAGEVAHYPLIENQHEYGILHRSVAPAAHCGEELTERAVDFAMRILTELNYVGVLTLEWFQDGAQLIANEIAPRVHNSGHWTLDSSVVSQFENHIRAICGYSLGNTTPRGASVMYNCIGTLPSTREMLSLRGARFHNYGKADRPGRKVGHITYNFETFESLEAELPTLDVRHRRG